MEEGGGVFLTCCPPFHGPRYATVHQIQISTNSQFVPNHNFLHYYFFKYSPKKNYLFKKTYTTHQLELRVIIISGFWGDGITSCS